MGNFMAEIVNDYEDKYGDDDWQENYGLATYF